MRIIPFLSLEAQHTAIRADLDQVWRRVLQANNFILGTEVQAFEQAFASYHQVPYSIGVGNGLDAIYLCLRAGNIGQGDEVLVPSHTCYATWLAVMRTGALPVPVEVDDTYTMDPSRLEEKISQQTKAVIPVHLYGYPCDMPRIMEIAHRHSLWVVEDNAQAHGASIQQRKTGSWGHANATSFYPTKNLGALGDGGAVTTTLEEVNSFLRQGRNYGAIQKDIHVTEGLNTRLDELQAAVLRVKLQKLDEWNEERQKLAQLYHENLSGIKEITLPPKADAFRKPVYHLFVIQANRRDELQMFLRNQGVSTSIHYPVANHLQKSCAVLQLPKGSLPIAERLAQTVISLPLYPGLSSSDVHYITDQVSAFYKE